MRMQILYNYIYSYSLLGSIARERYLPQMKCLFIINFYVMNKPIGK